MASKIRIIHRLDAKPFSCWLQQRIKYYGSQMAFADSVEQDSTWINKIVDGKYKTVDIDQVDLILCKDGTTHLREIYPELYEEGK